MTAALNALTAELIARYPAIAAVLPLTIGVHEELVAAGYDPALLRKVIFKHVNSTTYVKKLARGGKRHKLDGTEAEDIEQEHVANAFKTVGERRILLGAQITAKITAAKARKEQEAANRAAKQEQLAKTAANAKKAGKAMPAAQAAAKVVKPAPKAATPPQTRAAPVPKPSVDIPIIIKKKRIVLVPK